MTNEDLKALLDAAETVQNEGKYDEAEQLAIKALALLTSSGEDRDTFVKRVTLEEMKPEEILWITGEIGTQANDAKHRARIFRILGNVARLRGNYFAALDHYTAALALDEAINNREGIAKVMTDFGLVYQNLSDYTQALEYYQKALAIFKESGNNIGIANNLGNIGGVYQSMSDHTNALEYYKLALKIFEESGSKMGIARNFTNIGIVSHNLADYAQALEYYQKALAIYEEFGRKDGIAICLGNIGTAYVELSDYTKALEYYNIALAINEELGSKEGVAINLGNLGANYANPKFDGYNAAKAEEHLLEAITIDQEIGVKRHLYVLHQFLAALYRNEKRWEEADKNFQIYHDMEKEVQSEEAKKQVRLMEQRRQAEEQAKQIAIVKARHEATEQLLHNVLPPKIAHKILDGSKLIAEKLSGVSVLFADIVDFTKLSQRISPEELVEGLDGIFSEFDTLTCREAWFGENKDYRGRLYGGSRRSRTSRRPRRSNGGDGSRNDSINEEIQGYHYRRGNSIKNRYP